MCATCPWWSGAGMARPRPPSISSTCGRACTTSPPPRWASTTWTTTCATSRITGTRTRGPRAASSAPGASPSERALLRHEILEARHDLTGQELHRVAPRLRVLRVVEAEQQQGAEAADLLVDLVESLGHRGRRAHQPVVASAVFWRHVGVGHVRLVLQELGEAEGGEEGQEVFSHHAAHHAARGE